MVKKQRIQTLEVLRGIAYVSVMLHHTLISAFDNIGTWAVSIFLILSGFVAVYSQYDVEIVPSFKNNFKYAIGKIKKLYLLYVITTLSIAFFGFVGEHTDQINIALVRIIINLLLIQEWLPLNTRSLNGPSWYLCTLFLFYLVFPYVLKEIKKYKTINKASITILFLFIFQIIIGIIGSKLPVPRYHNGMLFVYNTPLWAVYFFPPARLIDIIIGCNLGYIFMQKQKDSVKNATKKEIIVIVLVIISLLIRNIANQNQQTILNVPVARPELWWTYVVLFTPSSVLLIYLFALGQGKISKGLINKPIMYLAKISPYGFLIHQVIFRCLESFIALFLKYIEIGRAILYLKICKLTFGIVITIVCCEIWIRLCDFCKKKYNSYLNNSGKV